MSKIHYFYFAIFVGVALASVSDKKRLCPEGFSYAGDDTLKRRATSGRGMFFYEETGRSDVYSCYRFLSGDDDGVDESSPNNNYHDDGESHHDNDSHHHGGPGHSGGQGHYNSEKGIRDGDNSTDAAAKLDFVSALNACPTKDFPTARLISFEDGEEELDRVLKQIFKVRGNETIQFWTSAVKFLDSEEFVWLTSTTTEKLGTYFNISDVEATDDPNNQCLTIKVTQTIPVLKQLTAVSCNSHISNYICEIRVQTVTYKTWFLANWFTVTIIILIILLAVSISMSFCAYNSGQKAAVFNRASPYKNAQQERFVNELPPSYEAHVDAQRIHDGLPPKPFSTSSRESGENGGRRMQQMLSRGKEALATIPVFNRR